MLSTPKVIGDVFLKYHAAHQTLTSPQRLGPGHVGPAATHAMRPTRLWARSKTRAVGQLQMSFDHEVDSDGQPKAEAWKEARRNEKGEVELRSGREPH